MKKKHPNKHIRKAIEYAIENGWDVEESGNSAHAFCRIKCLVGHSEHQMSIWSTPKEPENFAKRIIHVVKKCNGEEE